MTFQSSSCVLVRLSTDIIKYIFTYPRTLQISILYSTVTFNSKRKFKKYIIIYKSNSICIAVYAVRLEM